MKKALKRVAAVIICAVMVFGAAPLGGLAEIDWKLPEWLDFSTKTSAAKEGIYTYEVENGKATITGCDSSVSGAIVIPGTLGGYPVVKIGSSAFAFHENLTDVTIPSGVTSIGYSAFNNCTSLKSIIIPSSVTSIGDSAFSHCTSLLNITIPPIVTSIGNKAFYHCTSLLNITIPPSVTSIGNQAFYHCTFLLNIAILSNITSIGTSAFDSTAWYNNQADGLVYIGKVVYKYKGSMPENASIILRDDTVAISESAFYDCSSLTSITIPENVTCIGEHAFNNCFSLKTVNYNATNCTNSGYQGLFSGCRNITCINIGPKVKSIPNFTFRNLSSVTTITIPESVTSIGNFAFSECSSLTSITISENMLSINDYTFFGCSSLTSITIPESVTSIGDSAFSGCSSLTSVTIPESVTSIGDSAFFGCSSLASVTIPENMTSIGYSAFYNCYSLASITIPESVTSMGNRAFFGCNALKTINYNAIDFTNNSYDSIFEGCSNIEYINIGENVKKIPNYAFRGLNKVKAVTISESVISIGNSAFSGCTALETVNYNAIDCSNSSYGRIFEECSNVEYINIGENVKKIPNYAFRGLNKVKTVTIPESVTSIGDSAFYGCSSLTSITIPNNVISIGKQAFYSCQEAQYVTFGSSLKTIGDRAFEFCSGLTEITLNDGLEVVGIKAFANQPNVKTITIPQSVKTFYSGVFNNCTGLERINYNAANIGMGDMSYYWTYGDIFANAGQESSGIEVIFGNSVEVIPDYIFDVGSDTAKPKIASVTMGSGVRTIGNGAFRDCNHLTHLVIGENVNTIGDYAFSGCLALASITLPDSVISIGNGAFYGCSSLASIILPDSIISIGDSAFSGCSGINSLTIPQSVESIGTLAFSGCKGIETVYYNAVDCKTIGSIGAPAFRNCSSVKSAVVGAGVKSIPAYAFTGCDNLESIYIPDAVINIHNAAFAQCYNAAIYCKEGSYANTYAELNGMRFVLTDEASGTAFNIKNHVLISYGGEAQNVVLPSDITSVGYGAFKDNASVKSVEVPYCVSKISDYAFSGCSKLESVIIPYTVTSIGLNALNGTNAKIYCYANSYAHTFAVKNNIPFMLITLEFDAKTVMISSNESAALSVHPTVTLASGLPVEWSTSNPAVATVDASGKVTAVSKGTAIITANASFCDASGNCTVFVSGSTTEPVSITNPSTTSINYGDTIILHAAIGELPQGAKIVWSAVGSEVSIVPAEDGMTCAVTSAKSGDATVTATVVDAEGNAILDASGNEIAAKQQIKSKAGFLQKLIAFFKKLFGISGVITQAFGNYKR